MQTKEQLRKQLGMVIEECSYLDDALANDKSAAHVLSERIGLDVDAALRRLQRASLVVVETIEHVGP